MQFKRFVFGLLTVFFLYKRVINLSKEAKINNVSQVSKEVENKQLKQLVIVAQYNLYFCSIEINKPKTAV